MNTSKEQKIVDAQIKRNQDTVSKQFEELIQRANVRVPREVASVEPSTFVGISDTTYDKTTIAFLKDLTSN